ASKLNGSAGRGVQQFEVLLAWRKLLATPGCERHPKLASAGIDKLHWLAVPCLVVSQFPARDCHTQRADRGAVILRHNADALLWHRRLCWRNPRDWLCRSRRICRYGGV